MDWFDELLNKSSIGSDIDSKDDSLKIIGKIGGKIVGFEDSSKA